MEQKNVFFQTHTEFSQVPTLLKSEIERIRIASRAVKRSFNGEPAGPKKQENYVSSKINNVIMSLCVSKRSSLAHKNDLD